jgi:hypothetical protein
MVMIRFSATCNLPPSYRSLSSVMFIQRLSALPFLEELLLQGCPIYEDFIKVGTYRIQVVGRVSKLQVVPALKRNVGWIDWWPRSPSETGLLCAAASASLLPIPALLWATCRSSTARPALTRNASWARSFCWARPWSPDLATWRPFSKRWTKTATGMTLKHALILVVAHVTCCELFFDLTLHTLTVCNQRSGPRGD